MDNARNHPPVDASLSVPPAITFVERALGRLERIVQELQAIDRVATRECARRLDDELRILAAEAHFFGLVRTHRLARQARATLAVECGATPGSDAACSACELVLRLRAEIGCELMQMIEACPC